MLSDMFLRRRGVRMDGGRGRGPKVEASQSAARSRVGAHALLVCWSRAIFLHWERGVAWLCTRRSCSKLCTSRLRNPLSCRARDVGMPNNQVSLSAHRQWSSNHVGSANCLTEYDQTLKGCLPYQAIAASDFGDQGGFVRRGRRHEGPLGTAMHRHVWLDGRKYQASAQVHARMATAGERAVTTWVVPRLTRSSLAGGNLSIQRVQSCS